MLVQWLAFLQNRYEPNTCQPYLSILQHKLENEFIVFFVEIPIAGEIFFVGYVITVVRFGGVFFALQLIRDHRIQGILAFITNTRCPYREDTVNSQIVLHEPGFKNIFL